MGGGKEENMNGGSAIDDQVKDRRKRLKQKLFQTESAIKIFYQKSSPASVMYCQHGQIKPISHKRVIASQAKHFCPEETKTGMDHCKTNS
jgi:environmental stress-induced protein Ves